MFHLVLPCISANLYISANLAQLTLSPGFEPGMWQNRKCWKNSTNQAASVEKETMFWNCDLLSEMGKEWVASRFSVGGKVENKGSAWQDESQWLNRRGYHYIGLCVMLGLAHQARFIHVKHLKTQKTKNIGKTKQFGSFYLSDHHKLRIAENIGHFLCPVTSHYLQLWKKKACLLLFSVCWPYINILPKFCSCSQTVRLHFMQDIYRLVNVGETSTDSSRVGAFILTDE